MNRTEQNRTEQIESSSVKKDYRYLNILRIVAMISVVAIHSIETPMRDLPLVPTNTLYGWKIFSSFLNAFAVPVFIMISGALFLNPEKEITLKKLYLKNALRIFLDIMIFGSIFALMEIVFTNKTFVFTDIFKAIYNTLCGKTWGHMWYLYMTFGLYLVTPVFRSFVKSVSDKDFLIVLLVLYILSIVFPLFGKLTNIHLGFYVPVHGFIFYYLLGYAIHCEKLKIKNWLCILLFSVSTVCLIFWDIHLINLDKTKGLVFVTQYVGVLTASVFAFCKNNIHGSTNKVEKFVAGTSLGVYIFHVVFLHLIYKMTSFTPLNYSPWICYPVIILGTTLISMFVTWIGKLIPGIKKIL